MSIVMKYCKAGAGRDESLELSAGGKKMKIAEVLSQHPDRLWTLAKQAGVTHAVSRLPLKADGCYRSSNAILLPFREQVQGRYY